MLPTKTHKSALGATVSHGTHSGQRKPKRKINGIKHLAVISHEVPARKNRFKNKDLRIALKVLGEIRGFGQTLTAIVGRPSNTGRQPLE
jgi:hypothetical protein